MKKICYITTISGTLKAFVMPIAEYIHSNTDWKIYMICNPTEEFVEALPPYIHLINLPMERGISFRAFKDIINLAKIFKKEKFDLIQYSTPNASFYAAIAGFLAKIPVRLYCQWGMAYVGFSGFKRKIFKVVEKLVCKLSTWIEPDSRGNLEFSYSEKLYKASKSSVIWNGSASGINLEKFDISKRAEYKQEIRKMLEIADDMFVYVFIGRITRDKGINELFEAFSSLEKIYKDVCLLMVGPEELDENVNKDLYEHSKNSDKVIYAGYTNCVEKYLAAADCYVLPSYREGFGMSVVEAEAMGLPVIVTDIPGPTNAMKNNETGIIVKKADVVSLLEGMEYLYNNRDLVESFGNSGANFAKECFDQKEFSKFVLEDRKRLLGL